MSQSTMSGSNLASSPAASAGSDWKQWPYAVNVTQFISGGESVPDCYIMNSDKSQGDRITQGLTMQDAKKNCVCGYRNFGF